MSILTKFNHSADISLRASGHFVLCRDPLFPVSDVTYFKWKVYLEKKDMSSTLHVTMKESRQINYKPSLLKAGRCFVESHSDSF